MQGLETFTNYFCGEIDTFLQDNEPREVSYDFTNNLSVFLELVPEHHLPSTIGRNQFELDRPVIKWLAPHAAVVAPSQKEDYKVVAEELNRIAQEKGFLVVKMR